MAVIVLPEEVRLGVAVEVIGRRGPNGEHEFRIEPGRIGAGNAGMLHIYAPFAEHERRMISIRTKAALAAAKARGVKLGRHFADVVSKQNHEEAVARARQVEPLIRTIMSAGIVSARGIGRQLLNAISSALAAA
jgi:DNA invertase Pin-like site-specific DNA recombinase